MSLRILRVARQRLRALFRRDELDGELARELSFHVEQLAQEFVESGMSEREARQAARRAVGNIPLLEEQCRDTRRISWLGDVRQDVTYGARMLRRNPGFTAVALASLALGIGANTAILSVFDSVFRGDGELAIPQDDRLVVFRAYPFDNPAQEQHPLIADYFAWREEGRSFELIGASMGNNADFGSEADGTAAERIGGQSTTADTFAALRVQPLLGRVFTEKDEQTSDAAPTRVIVLSHRLWQRRFGGRQDIIGHEVQLDRVNRTIIGVMPEAFRYPNEATNYWIPARVNRIQINGPQRFYVIIARLKEGASLEQAQGEVDAIAARFARVDPDRHSGWGMRVKPVRDALFGWTRERLFTLGAAVALVLLVACANVAGLLLARGLVRGPEIALRRALGAGRGRIVRQLLTESVLLSFGGGTLGLAVAWVGIRALVAMAPPPGGVAIGDVELSLRTLSATAVIATLTGLFCGLAPALIQARSTLTGSLKEPAGGSGGHRPAFRSTLVAGQIAVTIVLLVGSGLLLKSFVRVMSRDLRFDTARLLSFEVTFPTADYLQPRGSIRGMPFYEISPPPSLKLERIHHRLAAIPGTESVAGISTPLLNSLVVPSATITLGTADTRGDVFRTPASFALGVGTTPAHLDDRRTLTAAYFMVTPSFFTAIKSPPVRGRDFDARDTGGGEWVAIVNESAARRFWPGSDPLGQAFTLLNSPDERPRKVIAVVSDIPLTREGDLRPAIYTSYLQQPTRHPQPGANGFGRMTFLMRSAGNDPMSLLPAARQVVKDVDPDRPLAAVGTMEQRLLSVIPQRGYFVLSIVAFALTATLLAAIGIYGVMAYSVTQRTREIGIRVALGATRGEVVALVGRRASLVVLLGLGAGLAGALAVTQLLQSQLWGVTPTDPATFALVSVLFGFVALIAAFFPMRRATAVDPTIALRCE
jgi:putative ABC transport system permease protein